MEMYGSCRTGLWITGAPILISPLFLFFQVQIIIPRIVLAKEQIVSDKTRDKNVREN